MNKTAIKNFAIEARIKMISEITYRAGLVGITKNGIAEPIHKADRIEMYDIGASDPYTIKGEQLKQRKSLAIRVKEKGFDNVIEEVAYTWFNRIIAIRFMEVNDYLPTRIHVLSSETSDKIEPDIVTEAPNIDLGFNSLEIDEILQLKNDNKLDELFRMLFIKQCNALNEILPELFEKTSDFTELLLSISFTNEDSIVRMLVKNIEEDDFKEQVEIIGWMYQYYNTELKDDTFAKLKDNVKITKERIPAATQLFTPDWIVRYMVENSLGRLWLEGHPESNIKSEWKYYLDEVEQEPDVKVQLEKLREDRKNIKPEDIKVIDPCMGSGHILVYAFDVLMDIYKSCGYEEREAAKLILQNNLYGLDIDDRAYQFAYFAVMMKARSYSRRILNERIMPNLCAIQESNGIIPDLEELLDYFVQGVTEIEKIKLKTDFKYVIKVYQDAKEYGSILDVKEVTFEAIERRIEEIKKEGAFDFFAMQYRNLIIEKVVQLVKQAKIMEKKYDVVVTNPPYMGGKGMSTSLSEYLQVNYSNSKYDLFCAFIEKCTSIGRHNGYISMITQNSWMFLSRYEPFRNDLLNADIINMAHLGPRAFDEISGEVVQTVAFVVCNTNLKDYKAPYIRLVDYNSETEKKEAFLLNENKFYSTKRNYDILPGKCIAYWISSKVLCLFKENKTIEENIFFRQGMATSDNNRFLKFWYEVNINKIGFSLTDREEAKNSRKKWFPYNKGGTFRKWFGNNDLIVNWENDGIEMKAFTATLPQGTDVRLKSKEYYFKEGFTWSALTSGAISIRYCPSGFIFDTKGSMGFPYKQDKLKFFIGLINSKPIDLFLSVLAPTMDFNLVALKQIPTLIDNELDVTKYVNDNIDISKSDWDSFETSWDYMSHPILKCKIENAKCKIADAYKLWNDLSNSRFAQIKSNEEELNYIFIKMYGLQEEMSSNIVEKDISIRRADLKSDVKSFISYAVGCMFGRYSLDVEGLVYAGGDWDNSKYYIFIPDADNIIPISDEEYFNDDMVGRFVEFLKLAFGADTLEENLDFIANALSNKGNTSREVIRQYFIKDFYKDHLKIYQKKPIYWLFDSGRENGFKALIYMHRYNQDIVGRMRVDYLHKTQKAIESAISRADMVIESNTNPLQKVKAVKEKGKLVKQLAETRVYDTAIGHIAAQRISIDLDDGVTVNYAKFQGVEISSEGKKANRIDLLGKI